MRRQLEEVTPTINEALKSLRGDPEPTERPRIKIDLDSEAPIPDRERPRRDKSKSRRQAHQENNQDVEDEADLDDVSDALRRIAEVNDPDLSQLFIGDRAIYRTGEKARNILVVAVQRTEETLAAREATQREEVEI